MDKQSIKNRAFHFSIQTPDITSIKRQAENITNIYRTKSGWIYDDVLIANSTSQDEVPLVSLPFYVKLIIIAVLTTCLLIGSFFKCIMYCYISKANKQNHGWMHRPINVLTVTSSVVHHATYISGWIWYTVELLGETSVADVIGLQQCDINQVVGLFGIAYLSVGSLRISVYRVLYIRHDDWVKYVVGEKLLLFLVLSLSLTVSGILAYVYNMETSNHRYFMNMCRGISSTHAQILIEYELSRGYPLRVTSYLQTIAVSILLAIRCAEFSIYVWFFHHRYTNDNGNIKKVLTHDVIRARNIKNVVTFLGQFYGFVIENTFLISILIIHYFAGEQKNNYKAFVSVTKFVDFGLLSAVEVFSSPALRTYLKSKIKYE